MKFMQTQWIPYKPDKNVYILDIFLTKNCTAGAGDDEYPPATWIPLTSLLPAAADLQCHPHVRQLSALGICFNAKSSSPPYHSSEWNNQLMLLPMGKGSYAT